jgi:hypothetical protein
VFHLIECRTPPEGSHSAAFIAQQCCSIEVGNNLFRRDVIRKAFQSKKCAFTWNFANAETFPSRRHCAGLCEGGCSSMALEETGKCASRK